MTRDELFALPAAIAVRVLYDCLDEGTAKEIDRKPAPVSPKPPRYDYTIFRREGVMYASECSLEGLRFWHKRAIESAASGGQYAEKDKRNAENLARWIAWREWYPEQVWSGERNREPVVARPPSDKPTVYPRNGGGNRPQPPPEEDLTDSDGDIPF